MSEQCQAYKNFSHLFAFSTEILKNIKTFTHNERTYICADIHTYMSEHTLLMKIPYEIELKRRRKCLIMKLNPSFVCLKETVQIL